MAAIWHAGASLPGVGPAVLPPIADLCERLRLDLVPHCRIVVAERAGEIVGFAALKLEERVLDQLFVRAGVLGGGIGRRLLDEAKRAMPEGFTLFTRPGNTRACRFYETAGLRRFRTDIHPRFGDTIVFYGWTP
ncbi:GNAT family N-acetyltransferase [Aureimonas flava]|uniref:GNAT family N-acetyltransferase n=1 Tax=Aureimonas flava TaxID=2320271 RepID=UPI001459FC53|nr:GNAT family N-acetyltransferase [Aureimonas flava]